jgi:cyanate permease
LRALSGLLFFPSRTMDASLTILLGYLVGLAFPLTLGLWRLRTRPHPLPPGPGL